MQQLRGHISTQVQEARQSILEVVARIEASIDFPEEEVPTPQPGELRSLITIGQRQVEALLAGSEQGRLYRQGLRTVIIGRPNVGKSSLLNALLRTERAIVTPIAGTTRDTVEEVANLRGIPLHLIDTAGITPSDDPVEQIGVQRSRSAAESADMVLLVFDGAESLTREDWQVSEELHFMGFGGDADTALQAPIARSIRRPVIVVINKADRGQRLEVEKVHSMWPGAPFVGTSTLSGKGLAELEETIASLVLTGKTLQGESALVTSARHQEALRRAAEHLRASLVPIEGEQSLLPLDFVSIDLRAAYDALGEITGETASDDLLDKIFSEFCIGK
jgi:tRNA modification GTPase